MALEINSNGHRLDLNDGHARLARERGVKLVISSDAHAIAELEFPRWGVLVARRAWVTADDVLNTRPLAAFRRGLNRGQRAGADRSSCRYTLPVDPVAEIKRLYYAATKATIQTDLERAIELMKSLPTDEERERAAVYMDGLSQMRSEWKAATGAKATAGSGEAPDYFCAITTFFRAAIRSGSGTFRSIDTARRSRSFRRWSRVSDIASGVFGFLVSPSMTL